MGLETGVTYIEDLVATNPDGSVDTLDESDNHHRIIKTAIQGSFPSLGAAAVTKTAAEINDLSTLTGTETLTNKTLDTPTIAKQDDLGDGGHIKLEASVTYKDINIDQSNNSFRVWNSTDVKILEYKTDTGEFKLDGVTQLREKVIDIGDWDMDATITVNVAHGLTVTKIRTISVLIRGDNDTDYHDFASIENNALSSTNASITAQTTNVNITRSTSGPFDSTAYNLTSYNRGWITIQYTE